MNLARWLAETAIGDISDGICTWANSFFAVNRWITQNIYKFCKYIFRKSDNLCQGYCIENMVKFDDLPNFKLKFKFSCPWSHKRPLQVRKRIKTPFYQITWQVLLEVCSGEKL